MAETVLDLTQDNCDQEPIHILGRIQSHGFLLVCRRTDLQIVQVSENAADYTDTTTETLLDCNLSELLAAKIVHQLSDESRDITSQTESVWSLLIPNVQIDGKSQAWNLIAHTAQDIALDLLLLEFEPMGKDETLQQYYQWPDQILQLALSSDSVEDISNRCAMRIKEFTGFDRVMVYRFDEDWHGEVIAEAKNEQLEPYLGLHYPASDIPAQARKLYVRNLVRIIADVDSETSVVTPTLTPHVTGESLPLNLSDSVLRAVSPIHIEYLQNMGVRASMSISIIRNGELWGLFACHHYAPKFVNYNLRSICKFVSTILSGLIETKLAALDSAYMAQLTTTIELLVKRMVEADWWLKGLTEQSKAILQVADATGAVIHWGGALISVGQTPSDAQVEQLAVWLQDRYIDGLFVTNRLPHLLEIASSNDALNVSTGSELGDAMHERPDSLPEVAGLLSVQLVPAVQLSSTAQVLVPTPDAIMWFRPEVRQTVDWGGKPGKERIVTEQGIRFSPRKSFEKWTQTVDGQSLPWKQEEIEAVQRLSTNIQAVIVSHTMKVERINAELRQANQELDAFSYTIAHDLRSPLRHIDSYSEILYEEYRDQLDDDALAILETVLLSTAKMKQLVNDLLLYSRIGRSQKILNHFDPQPMLEEVLAPLIAMYDAKVTVLQSSPLPQLYGDYPLIRQVFTNILNNAVKYSSRKAEPTVEIGGSEADGFTTIYVKDNGVGFDMEYVDKVYNVFGRLHSDDEFEGTGIGLAIVERIVSAHNGKTWIESIPSVGTTIYFSLPAYSESGDEDQ